MSFASTLTTDTPPNPNLRDERFRVIATFAIVAVLLVGAFILGALDA